MFGQVCTTYHQYSPVAFSVDAPQFDVGLGPDCSCTRGPIDQSQLPKTASLTNAGHKLIVHINLGDRQEKLINRVSNDVPGTNVLQQICYSYNMMKCCWTGSWAESDISLSCISKCFLASLVKTFVSPFTSVICLLCYMTKNITHVNSVTNDLKKVKNESCSIQSSDFKKLISHTLKPDIADHFHYTGYRESNSRQTMHMFFVVEIKAALIFLATWGQQKKLKYNSTEQILVFSRKSFLCFLYQ